MVVDRPVARGRQRTLSWGGLAVMRSGVVLGCGPEGLSRAVDRVALALRPGDSAGRVLQRGVALLDGGLRVRIRGRAKAL